MKGLSAKSINHEILNKNQFARFVANELGLPISYCNEAISYVIQGFQMAIREGKDVQINGFGTFINSRQEPMIRKIPIPNSDNVKEYLAPANYKPIFQAAKYFKDCATEYGEELFGENDIIRRK